MDLSLADLIRKRRILLIVKYQDFHNPKTPYEVKRELIKDLAIACDELEALEARNSPNNKN